MNRPDPAAPSAVASSAVASSAVVAEPAATTSAAADDHVGALLATMTTRQKVGQLNQRLLGWNALRRIADGFTVTDEALAEIERWQGMGALYAPLRADAWSGRSWADGGIRPEERAQALAALQDAVVAGSPHGTGVLISEEAPHGHQALGGTVLPVNLAVGASFDPEAVEEAARAVAAELAASGVHLALVSALDVLRDPRWGRSEETFGEDPLLAAELTRALVVGLQGEDRSALGGAGVGAVLKHLAAQGEAIGGRNGQSAHLGPHDLAEIHLPPVLAGLDAGAVSFMAAYNDIDGVPCCGSRELLTGLLRERHGFDGVVMADMFAVDRLATMTGDLRTAGRAGLLAGVDLSLCDEGFTTLHELAEDDERVAAQIDLAARRVLSLKERFGLLGGQTDPAQSVPGQSVPAQQSAPIQQERPSLELARRRAREASRRLAAESLVLLADDRSVLPLDPGGVRRIAVVGPYADDVPCMLGDYVAPQQEGTALSIADGLRAALPSAQVQVADWSDPAEVRAEDLGGADAVVVVIGGTSHRSYDDDFAENGAIAGRAGAATGGEGVDRADVSLPGAQDALVAALRDAVPSDVPLIAVVVAGRPHVLTDVVGRCDATLWAGYPGPFGGEAVADLLLGRAEPTGRLPFTLPAHPAVLPMRYNDRQEVEGHYQDAPHAALFPFGHGLGRTATPLQVHDLEAIVGGPTDPVRLRASVTVRETDPGQEQAPDRAVGPDQGQAPDRAVGPDQGQMTRTVLVLGHRRGGMRIPRRRELLAFVRVEVVPGEARALELTIPAARFFADPSDPTCRTELDVEGSALVVAPPAH